MRVRRKGTTKVVQASSFTREGEVVMGNEIMNTSLLDVYIEATGEWIEMTRAFMTHDIITNARGSKFFEPRNETERRLGYSSD